MLIGIGGRMGAGKDTAAEILGRERGFIHASFANELRLEVSAAIAAGKLAEGCPVSLEELETEDPWVKPTPPNMRKLLQWHGTDYRRAQNPYHWVHALIYRISPTFDTVISDVRFPNEADVIRELGGQVWRITGRGAVNDGIPGHPSEELGFTADLEIVNDGSIEDLREKIIQCLTS